MPSPITTPIKCEFCGRELKARTLQMMGREVFAGYDECYCARAVAKREEQRKAEALERERESKREFLRIQGNNGVMPRYQGKESEQGNVLAAMVLDGKNLFIYGTVGTGKTELASCIATALQKNGKRYRMVRMATLLESIKRGFGHDYDPMESLRTVPVLILDDMGKESPTDWALERIFDLVDERNGRMLPTVVTSNYKPTDLIKRLAKNGDMETAVAIVSRLRQDCKSVELTGKDWRRA